MTADDGAIPEALRAVLPRVLRIIGGFKDEWWIIGSAAMALLGVHVDVADIDILTSRDDALRVAEGETTKSDSAHRFRSVYRRIAGTPIPIEIMGGLEVYVDDHWRSVRPATRIAITLPEGVLFIPDGNEQLRLLRLFGRPKDGVRAESLVKSGIRARVHRTT
jgi:hypothetical protein